jgi:IS30 family transposase
VAIETLLRVHRSTVSREITSKKLHHGYPCNVRPQRRPAETTSIEVPGPRVIEQDPSMQEVIRTQLIKIHRSPEQIAHALRLSHQTVYA